MPTGGVSGADSASASKGSAPPSPSKAESAGKAGSYSRADRQAKAGARKSDSNPEQRSTNAQNGHGVTVDEQGQKLQDFDKVQGRPPLGERPNGNGRNEGVLDTAGCAAGAAKDVVVDTVSGAYHSIKDAGGAVLDQAGVDGYEDHTQRTVERGEAAWEGAKNAGKAAMSPIETAGRIKNAAKAELGEIQAEIDNGESCKLAERVGGALGHVGMAVIPGGAIVKGGKALKALSRVDGRDKPDGPEGKAEPTPTKTAERFDELKTQGHGPQRHGPGVTTQQLDDRVLKGHDPITGTTTDGVTGRGHRQPRTATRIKAMEDFVAAEKSIRASEQYRDQRDAALFQGKQTFEAKVSLNAALGEGYLDKIEGKTRVGPKNPPHSVISTDLTNGEMRAVFKFDPGSEPRLITMYPVLKK